MLNRFVCNFYSADLSVKELGKNNKKKQFYSVLIVFNNNTFQKNGCS